MKTKKVKREGEKERASELDGDARPDGSGGAGASGGSPEVDLAISFRRGEIGVLGLNNGLFCS